MRFVNLVFYVVLIFPLSAFAWQKVSTNNDLYDPSNGDRISIYQNERGFIASAGSNNSSGINPLNQPEGEYVYHKTAKEAFESAVSNGYCGSKVDYSTLSCYTAPSSGANTTPSSNSNTGASSNNSSSGNSSGSSGGSGEGSTSGSGSGSTSGSTTETQGLPDSLPIPETNRPELQKAFEDLRKRYAGTFKSLKEDEIAAKQTLARCLDDCVLLYGKSYLLPVCSKSCHDSYDYKMESIQEAFERLQKQMNEDIRKILESSKVTPPSIPSINPDLSIPDISVSVSSDGSGNSGTGTSITNNSSETTNINNTTNVTNNNTSVHGGGGGTTNVTVNTKDYSGFLGGIRSSLDSLAQKIDNLISSDKEQDKEQQECQEGTLGCAELGNLNDVKLNDENFEINKEEVDVSQNFVFRRVVGGSAVCPAPIQVNTPIFSFVISYDLVCQYANLIRGFVLLAFSVVALRIALKEV